MSALDEARQAIEALAQLARSGQSVVLDRILGELGPGAAALTDHKGDPLLMLAAYHGHADAVRVLVRHGADPEARNPAGLSALEGAAFKGDLSVMEALVLAGAALDEPGPDGRTPLAWAASFGREGAVRWLLEHGADPTRRDRSGLTAADHARSMGASLVLPLLDRRGPPSA